MSPAILRLLSLALLAALLPACGGSGPGILPVPPASFDLTSPTNAQANVPTSTLFAWTASAGADSYTLEVSTSVTFSPIIFQQLGLTNTSLLPPISLLNGTAYYWRVTAINAQGSTLATGAPFTFTTIAPAPGSFTLTTPVNAATNVTSPSFTWTTSSGAASYTFQVSTDAAFSNIIFDQQNIVATTLSPSLNLTSSTQYFWRVVAIGVGGSTSSTGVPFSFTTAAPPPTTPGAFSMTAPADAATGILRLPTFTWGAASGAVSYTVQVSTSNTFATFVVDQAGLNATSFKCPVLLGSLTPYFWRVTAVNLSGPTLATGAPLSFTTANTPPGSLDTSFGTGGKALLNMSAGGANCRAMVLQSDGKIVLGGSASGGVTSNFAVARINDDGTFDTAFNGTGFAVTPMGTSGDQITSLALQTDGKIVAAGFAGFGGVYKFALARYNVDGSLDGTFGTGGRVTTELGSGGSTFAYGVVVQSDGKIVAGGYASDAVGQAKFALVRYNGDGTVDAAGFGTNGIVLNNVLGSSSNVATALAIQADQKLLLAGRMVSTIGGTNINSVVVRYNTNGTLDTAGFGTNGVAELPFNVSNPDLLQAMTIQPDQKILVSGWVQNANGFDHDITLIRLTTGGAYDTTFNTTGIVTTSIDLREDEGQSIAVQADGKIVIAALATRPDTTPDFAAARYTAAGALDATFNGTGIVRTVVGVGGSVAMSVQIDAYGRILVAGSATSATEGNAAVLRYWP
jgi:uncharacterized delta-60 repeat protein